MSLSTILFAYLLGGITFLPLLLAAVILPAWLALPQIQVIEGREAQKDDFDEGAAVKAAEAAQDDKFSPEGAASASFAVLRSYDFPSAVAALNSKNSAAASTAGEGAIDGTAQESVSVYQSMYRSVFDRSKTALHNKNTVMETEGSGVGTGAKAKPSVPGKNVFYVVLRHGHLMLYDTPAQLEVRHVISLAHHKIALSDGDDDDESIMDADLFVKRTAILLDPILSSANGNPLQAQPRPFYLFSSTCSEKEDFYHALLAAQSEPPVPQPLDPTCAIKLQSTLHSTSLTPETRALNALISRVFLALHRTDYAERFVRSKIERKIERVQKPAFIASLAVQSIDLGDAAPILSNPRLKDLHISGDMILAMDCKYSGGVKVVISAIAKLDLGPRFKVRTVDLVLAGSLQRLQGRILVRIKPPPSNRIWFTFDGMPDMDIKVEPIVSSRQITYTFILRAIENRIREVVAETLVKPNWDDVPFFTTIGQSFRGGLWQQGPEAIVDENEHDSFKADGPLPVYANDMLASRTEKAMSMPALPRTVEPADNRGTSSGSQLAGGLTADSATSEPKQGVKRRSVVSLPPQPAQTSIERVMAAPPRPTRSPSLASPMPAGPSTAVDGANVDAIKGVDVPRSNKRWMGRTSLPVGKRDVADVVREVRDRAAAQDGGDTSGSPVMRSSASIAHGGHEGDVAMIAELGESGDRKGDASSEVSRNASTATLPRSKTSLPSAPSRTSTAGTNATTVSSSSNDSTRLRGKNLLAATAAATTAARQWTWNAMASRNKGSPGGQMEDKPGVQEPMGRGQPLPPPGMPLPGPHAQRGIWSGSSLGSVKRKPVLPARRNNATSRGESSQGEESSDMTRSMEDLTRESSEDDFGPWKENHIGLSHNWAEEQMPNRERVTDAPNSTSDDGDVDASRQLNIAPALPPRRKRAAQSPAACSSNTSSSGSSMPSFVNDTQETDTKRAESAPSNKVKPNLPARPGHGSSTSVKCSSFTEESPWADKEFLATPAPMETAGEVELSERNSTHVTGGGAAVNGNDSSEASLRPHSRGEQGLPNESQEANVVPERGESMHL